MTEENKKVVQLKQVEFDKEQIDIFLADCLKIALSLKTDKLLFIALSEDKENYDVVYQHNGLSFSDLIALTDNTKEIIRHDFIDFTPLVD